MQTVPLEFVDTTFTYSQLQRVGMVALYCQQHKAAGTQRFEVVRLRIQAPHLWPNGVETPEREAYPSARVWGLYGWTFLSLPEAQQHFDALVSQEAPAVLLAQEAHHEPA